MGHWIFKDPFWLLALFALPTLIWIRRRRTVSVLVVPFAASWFRPGLSSGSRWPVWSAYFGIALLIVALARPQKLESKHQSQMHGYDIVLAIDLSGSMAYEDYERGGHLINRLAAVKPVIEAFINKRQNDRIGLVVFAGRAYTLAPLTFDHDWIRRQTERLRINMLEDGTAIGDGIGVAISRIEQGAKENNGPRQGAFIVLLTDGANNTGQLTPEEATQLAKAKGITIYTIGAGKSGMVRMPLTDDQNNVVGYRMVPSDLDEGTLRKIAEETGGDYFRAASSSTISDAFSAIDHAKKIEFAADSYVRAEELFSWFAVPGLACLCLAAVGTLATTKKEVVAA